MLARWRDHALAKRAHRARERQLDYLGRRAVKRAGHEEQVMTNIATRSRWVRERLGRHRPIGSAEKVLEVGSRATA